MTGEEQIAIWKKTGREQARRFVRVTYLWSWYQIRDSLRRFFQSQQAHGVFATANKRNVGLRVGVRRKHCIFLSQVEWDSMTQRPHHLAHGLCAKGVDVWFVNPSFLDAQRHKRPSIVEVVPHLFVVTLCAKTPYMVHSDVCSSDDAKLFSKQLRDLFHGVSANKVNVLTEHAFWTELCRVVPWEVTYDCIDDVTGFAIRAPGILKLEQSLCQIASHVSATSLYLVQKLQRYRDDVTLIPNGCDIDNFRLLPVSHGPLQAIKGPVFAYYGFLDIWFDRKLVRAMARAMKESTFVLIGPVADPRIYQLALEENIVFTGRIPYTDLAFYLRDADVFMIPFRLIPLILATDPVKFYEMLAMGKPIISTRLPSLIPFSKRSGLVSLASTSEEWVERLKHSLSTRTPALKRLRKKESTHHTWDVRVDALYTYMYET